MGFANMRTLRQLRGGGCNSLSLSLKKRKINKRNRLMPTPDAVLPSDYQADCEKELKKKWDAEARIFEIQNQALAAANQCPFPMRTPEMCDGCGDLDCIEAYELQEALWKKLDKEAAEE